MIKFEQYISESYVNDVYTMTKEKDVAGYYVDKSYFTIGKRYRLTYKIRKIEGTLKNIGGHSRWANKISFKIDSKESEEYFTPAIPFAPNPTVNITDDFAVHLIEFEFNYTDKGDQNGNIYIFNQIEVLMSL